MTLDFKATPEEVMRAVDALREFGQACGVPENILFGLTVALEECGANIVHHALRDDARQSFQVAFELEGDAVIIELRDHGPRFDPTIVAAAAADSEEERAPGGWGLQLIRRYTDAMGYARHADQNVLRLTKRIGAVPGESHCGATGDFRSQPNTINQIEPTHMPLEIHILKDVNQPNATAATVKLSGSLDTATAPDLERQLAPVLGSGVKDLIFDLADLKFISSAGLRVFANSRKQLKERGGQASFVHMQPQIQEVFEIMKSLPGIAIFKDVAELDRYLAARQRSHQA